MWKKADLRLPLQEYPEVPRGWRAVRELGYAMDKELHVVGIDPEVLTNSQLEHQIRKHLKGGTVGLMGGLERPNKGFRSCLGKGKGKWLGRILGLYGVLTVVVFFIGLFMMSTTETEAVVKGKIWKYPVRDRKEYII